MTKMKTPEQMLDEKNTLAILVIAGFVFPPLWIIVFLQWVGGAGKQV